MAAAANITLIVLLAAMNNVAIILREHFRGVEPMSEEISVNWSGTPGTSTLTASWI